MVILQTMELWGSNGTINEAVVTQWVWEVVGLGYWSEGLYCQAASLRTLEQSP